ncbi:MAG: hypothetical protein WCA07_07115 [Gloeobacterales cyanobacterium]
MSKRLNSIFYGSKLQRVPSRFVGVLLTLVCAGLSAFPVSAVPTDKLLAQEQSLPPAQPIPTKSQLIPITPNVALERFFTTEPNSFRAEWFAPNFKIQGSNAEVAPRVASHISQIKSQFGSYKSVEARGKEFVVELSRGSVPAQIELNPEGQITKLEFSTPSRAPLPSGKAYRSPSR